MHVRYVRYVHHVRYVHYVVNIVDTQMSQTFGCGPNVTNYPLLGLVFDFFQNRKQITDVF